MCPIEWSYVKTRHSHQPVLYEILKKSKGSVIEFGVGYGSTGFIHEICKEKERTILSFDNNLEWLNIFRQKYLTDWHLFYFTDNWQMFLKNCPFNISSCDIAFIDQAPLEARIYTILSMKNISQWCIVHDWRTLKNMIKINEHFKSIKVFNEEKKHSTLLASNFNDCQIELEEFEKARG